MILLDAKQSRELDRLSREKYGIDSYALMTRAGDAVARALLERFRDAARAGVTVVAGRGNNGGDGFVAARKLTQEGVAVRVVLLARAGDLKGDAARAGDEFKAAGGAIIEATAEAAVPAALAARPGVIIGAIFGTGLNAEVAGIARRAIELVNAMHAPVIAVDIASGVSADTGAIMGIAMRASLTVTFGYAKYGHVSFPGADYCGALEVANIGFAPGAIGEIAPRGRYLEVADVRHLVHRRPMNSHKGNYGHVMVIAGSLGKSGAALLASRGALRMGAGLVTAAVPQSVQTIVAGDCDELMTEPIADCDGHFDGAHAPSVLRPLISGKDALVVGPGIGLTDDTRKLIEWLINEGASPHRPLLIDADGLNALAALGCESARAAKGAVILTPHPGEAARLLGESTAEVNADRIGAARRLAERTGAHILLKGARSVVAAADGVLHVNSSGNPGMATPGMGDALSGMVGALLGQGMGPLDALALGTFLHGFAADRIATRVGRVGYLAGDVIEELPAALEALAS
jgi:ADP-dependent NAD(P)H-hydrate dehydratase / NAD(P)H-hydrate epimerase